MNRARGAPPTTSGTLVQVVRHPAWARSAQPVQVPAPAPNSVALATSAQPPVASARLQEQTVGNAATVGRLTSRPRASAVAAPIVAAPRPAAPQAAAPAATATVTEGPAVNTGSAVVDMPAFFIDEPPPGPWEAGAERFEVSAFRASDLRAHGTAASDTKLDAAIGRAQTRYDAVLASTHQRHDGVTRHAESAQEAIGFSYQQLAWSLPGQLEQGDAGLDASLQQQYAALDAAALEADAQVDAAHQRARRILGGAVVHGRAAVEANHTSADTQITAIVAGLASLYTTTLANAATECTAKATRARSALSTWERSAPATYAGGMDGLDQAQNEAKRLAAPRLVAATRTRLNERATQASQGFIDQQEPIRTSIAGSVTPELNRRRDAIGVHGVEAVNAAFHRASAALREQASEAHASIATMRNDARARIFARRSAARARIASIGTRALKDARRESDTARHALGAALRPALALFSRSVLQVQGALRAAAPRGAATLDQASAAAPGGVDNATSRAVEAQTQRIDTARSELQASMVRTGRQAETEAGTEIDAAGTDLSAQVEQDVPMFGATAHSQSAGFSQVSEGVRATTAMWSEPLATTFSSYIAEVNADLTRRHNETVDGNIAFSVQVTTAKQAFVDWTVALETPATYFASALEDAWIAVNTDIRTRARHAGDALYSGIIDVVDEAGLSRALRNITAAQGAAIRQVFLEIRGRSLDDTMQFRVITGDLDADEFQVAQTYLSGNAREGNRLELDASRGFFNDDEARIEEIMRTLSPTDLEALHNTAGWAETAARVRSALGGTDEDVFDALDAGRPARADALRWRDRMNEARLRGETDSLQDAAAEYSGATSYGGSAVSAADRRRMVQQEFATLLRESGAVERGEVTEAQLATPGEAVAAYATRSTAVLHSSWLSGIRVENEAVTGNDQQLLRDTILGGEDSVAARQSRLAVEFGRDGGPRMLRIDSALVDPRLNPNTYPGGVIPPDILAAARADREAVVSGFRTRFHDTDPNGPSDRDYLGSRIDRAFGSDTYGANIANLLMYEEVPSPATASHMMRYGMTHEMGTNEALLDRVVGRMNRDEIAQMQTHYNQFGSDLRADLGVYGHGTFGELSGDERLSMEVKLLGVPRNDRERAEVATFTAQQQRDETGGVGGWLASHDFQGDALTYEMNRLHQSSGISVRRDAEGMPVFSGGEHNFTDGAYTGRDRAMFESSASGAVDAAHSFSARVDTYANFAANAIMVIGAVVATVLTAGGAGPLLLAAIAAGTGLTAMAARRMISGGRYGWEQALTDLGTTLVQALTAGLGASLGLASRGGSAAVGTGMRAGLTGRIPQELLRANMGRLTGTALGDTLLIGAATNGLNSLGSTAMNEATWERGFGHGMGELLSGTGTGVFTGMLGAGIGHGLGAIRPGAIPGIGRMMSKANQTSTLGDLLGHASPVTRALGQGGIAGISGFGSRYAELAIQAGRGRFHGDAGDMFVESGQAGLQAGFQGMGESFGEQFVQHRMEVAARRAAATDSGADIRALPEPPPVRALPAHVEPEPPALVVPTHAATEPVIVPPARTGAAPESVPEAGSGAVPPRAPHEGDGDGGGGGGPRPPHEDDRLFPNLTDAEIDAAFAGAEARLMVRVGAEQPGADTRALLPAVPGEPTLQQRQRAGALHEQADGLAQRSNAALDQAIETAARARAAAAYNPRRAAALHAAAEAQLQEAINLDNQATARRQEAAEFTSGRRSPLADLPGPDDLLNQIDTLAPEASGLVNVPLSAVETNPALLERMARMLVSGEHGGRMVFRVESERSRSLVSVDAAGNVTVAGGASVHVNFGSFERAVEFVLDSARGNARIFAFEVDEAWVRSARSAAIPEHETAALGGRQPRLVDVRFADDQMEIPPGLIGELNRFIIPGSGMQFEIPASRRPSPPDEGGPPVSLGGGPDQAEAMRQALLRHVPTDQHGAMADVPIEILAPDQYRAMTRSDSGPVVTLIRDGRPVVVVREGTPIGRLADEGPHLSQAHEAPTQARVARLDEAALAHWDELDLDTQLDLYRNKVELEIDAHTRIATSLDSEGELGAADPARLAREREGNDMTLRNLRARLDEVAALGPRQRADIASGAMERPQYLDQPARLFSKRSGYEGQPELRAPRSSADPDTPDGRRQIHEDWVEQMRRGFLDPGSMPSMVPDGGAIPNRMLWHDTIDSAYAVYDQVLRASGGSIEVGIARDGRTGRYMVARGGPVSVRYPNESMFLETVLHYHPDYGPALYHGPSGTDLQSAIATAKSSGRPVTEFIEHGDANGRARTAFTVTRIDDANVPGGVRVQVDLEYVRQGTGEYRHQRFNSMREWSDYYHARTTALDPDGPVYRSLLAGAIAARDRRQTVGPRQAVTGDEMPPSPEHAGLQRAVRAAQRSEEAVDARLEVNRNERLALEGERDLLRASADGSPPERLGRVEARLARLQAAADALEVRRAAAADKTTAAQAAVARSTAEREQAAREAAARPPPPPVVLEYPGGTDRQPSVPYTGPETTLYHYTDAAGLAAILLSQELRLSTGPTHARFGDGQYFTDLAPEAIGARTIGDLTAEQRAQGLISASQASQRLFNDTRMVGRLLHYIEIDVSGLPLRQGMLPSGAAPRDNVQFVLGSTNFPLAGRIVRSGRTY